MITKSKYLFIIILTAFAFKCNALSENISSSDIENNPYGKDINLKTNFLPSSSNGSSNLIINSRNKSNIATDIKPSSNSISAMYIIQAQTAIVTKKNQDYLITIKRNDLYDISKFTFKSKLLELIKVDALKGMFPNQTNLNKISTIYAGNLKSQLINIKSISFGSDSFEVIVSKKNYGTINTDKIIGLFHDFLMIIYN